MQYEQCMLIKLDLEKIDFDLIKRLIDQKKYENVHEFIKLSIKNQLEEENSFKKNSGDLKKSILVDNKLSITDNTWKEKIPHIISKKSDSTVPEKKLIWSFYNRFFPVKVIVHKFGDMMGKENETEFDLFDVQRGCYEFAHETVTKLKQFEKENHLTRNSKISTGLPTPEIELEGLKGKKRKLKQRKLDSSKRRFMEHFVGTFNNKSNLINGASFTLGLLNFHPTSDSFTISLSELGKEFAMLKNPILDEGILTTGNFSFEETKFIFEQILPKFSLEHAIVKNIIQNLKKSPLNADELDVILQKFDKDICEFYDISSQDIEKKDKTIVQTRIAIMGRLYELKIVFWNIDKLGKSTYELNSKLIQNLESKSVKNSNLKSNDYHGQDIHNKDFRNLDLTGANFSDTNIEGTKFDGSNLSNANFLNADISTSSFRDTNLSNANFVNAKLIHSVCSNANFRNANLRVKKIGNVEFQNTVLDGAKLPHEFLKPEKYLIMFE